MKHFQRTRHGDDYLFKLRRTQRVVAGVIATGKVLSVANALDDLTDDEMLELLRETGITSQSVKGKGDNDEDYYLSSQHDLVKLVRLMPGKLEGNQYAEVRLTADHRYRGKTGDIVLWLWQDLRPMQSVR